jgi:AcrR family transcriptional regulator
MARDPEMTKKRLLDAAVGEFASHGFAGARIDRIAALAETNKRMIYAYFGNKEELFEKVVAHSLQGLLDTVPVRPDDLPRYAGELFDYLVAHPERRRLALWRQLEDPTPTPAERESTRDKLDHIAAARPDDTGLSPAAMLAFVMAVVQAWPNAAGGLTEQGRAGTAEQRASVVEAVRRLARTG